MKELRYMNNDVPFEVLSRLLATDLHKLKCVCKEWRSLISDRSFIRLQLKMEPLSGFFFQEKYQWCDYDIEDISYISLGTTKIHRRVFSFLPESVVILSSCNGLICSRSSFRQPKPILYVCNPLNKEWMSLEWIHPSKRTSVALVFDPFRFPLSDDSANFKVVTVSQSETETEECEFLFEIYSSETKNWSQSKETCRCKHNLFKNKGIYVDGLLYWLTDGDKILMFDPELEFSWMVTMPLPFKEFRSIPEMCIGESKGKLHYVLLCEQGLQLWVLQDHFASQWDLTCSIPLKKLEEENSEFLHELTEKVASRVSMDMYLWMDLLSFKDGILFVRISTDTYSYHFDTRKLKKLCNIFEFGKNSLHFPIVVPYSMSLVPLA